MGSGDTGDEYFTTYYPNGYIKSEEVTQRQSDGSWTKTTRTYDENGILVDESTESGSANVNAYLPALYYIVI